MLNLFDDWQRGSIDLVRSQKIAGIKVPTVVINDDGFLPAEVDSPIKQYRKQTGEPRYFDQVQVPRFWQMQRVIKTQNQLIVLKGCPHCIHNLIAAIDI